MWRAGPGPGPPRPPQPQQSRSIKLFLKSLFLPVKGVANREVIWSRLAENEPKTLVLRVLL